MSNGEDRAPRNVKTRSTFFTPAKIAAARANIERYAWAQSMRDRAVDEADKYLELGAEFLWGLVTAQSLPRSYAVNQEKGSPVTGLAVNSFGNYPYTADPVGDPWKLTDPSSGCRFPTNDFGAYYRSGLDSSGRFTPELADRTLLVNTLYPEKGPSWGVDDGYGWIDDNGDRYTFIAYYLHWHIWHTGIIRKALNAFRDAYLFTGDMKYARCGTILLDRIADVYPEMDCSAYLWSDGFRNSHGGSGHGKVVGSIWETNLVKDFIEAYDAFYPAMDDDGIISFLSRQADRYALGDAKRSAAGIRGNIEDGIIRQVYPGVKSAKIAGNNGMHQSALAMAAVVLDTLPETQEWLDFTFQAGGRAANPLRITGGNVSVTLVDDVDRDGMGDEAAPSYNRLWLGQYQTLADILDGYDLYPAADLYKNVKFRKMFSVLHHLLLSGDYMAGIGDSGNAGGPGHYLRKDEYIKAFEKFGDPVYAQLAFMLNGGSTEGIHSSIFTPNPEEIAGRIAAVIERCGTLELKSSMLSGYGFAALRDGDESHARDVWLYFGRNTGHGHRDTLNIGLHAFGLDLLPELGYPEYADSNARRSEWENHTISHNTVLVDKTKQSAQAVGQPKHFDDGRLVKLIDVEAPRPYPDLELYRRSTALIAVDSERSYVVDFFRVKGGNDHHFSFHAANAEVTAQGLKLVRQETGSYAGPDIPYGERPEWDSKPGPGYTGGGFHYLHNVERDVTPPAQFSVDWKINDTWGRQGNGAGAPTDIHLRLTLLEKTDDVALVDGIPPRNKPGNPPSLRYLLAHRAGDHLQSMFASVIEPYKGERFIRSIAAVSVKRGNFDVTDGVEAKAIRVELADGRVDYIVCSLDLEVRYHVDGRFEFQGFFGMYREQNGAMVESYLHDGSFIGKVGETAPVIPRISGVVNDFTKELSINNRLIVALELNGLPLEKLVGRTLYAENDGLRNAAYRIQAVAQLDNGQFALDIGDTTLIRSYRDRNDFSQGFVYDLAEGAKFSIPLTSEIKI